MIQSEVVALAESYDSANYYTTKQNNRSNNQNRPKDKQQNNDNNYELRNQQNNKSQNHNQNSYRRHPPFSNADRQERNDSGIYMRYGKDGHWKKDCPLGITRNMTIIRRVTTTKPLAKKNERKENRNIFISSYNQRKT